MLETQLQSGEIKESKINLKIGLPMASGSISFELFWQVYITDHGWELLPVALRAGQSSNTSNGGAHLCWGQTLLPHIKEEVFLLRCG